MAEIDIPHLALPVRTNGGAFVYTEQGSPDEIIGCVEAVLRYPAGYRDDLPDFGRDDPTFTTGDPSEEITRVIDEWEPRADTLVGAERDRLDETIETVIVAVDSG